MRMAIDSRNAVYAGIAAGVIATVVQLVLWWAFWDVLPAIFYRAVRLAAAILLGSTILPPRDRHRKDETAYDRQREVHDARRDESEPIEADRRRRMRTSLLIGAVFG